jgi:hypothetical protein
MLRSPAFLLACSLSAVAQSVAPPPVAPITGTVSNAITGAPIAGATVYYYGLGNLSDREHGVLNPQSLRGETRTDAAGRYTLPPVPPGEYHVRASATGFLADSGKGRQGYAHDLELQPNSLNLQSMSGAALAEFALPLEGFSGREYHASAFTPDGDRFAFFTTDVIDPPLVENATSNAPAFRRCVAWIYNLTDGTLTSIDQFEEQHACESTAIAWYGGHFYTNSFPYPNSQTGSLPIVERIQAPTPTILQVSDLPKAVQQKLGAAAKLASSPQSGTSPDGLFTFSVAEEGRSFCGPIVVTNNQTHQRRAIGNGCDDMSFLMLVGDRLLWSGSVSVGEPGQLTEYNLMTGTQQIFPVPASRQEPQLLAMQPLPDGKTRIAYAIKGDCDPESSD